MTRKEAGILLAVVGAILVVWASSKPDPADYDHWVPAPGLIVDARLVHSDRGPSRIYHPIVEYTYDVGNSRYTGRRLSPLGFESPHHAEMLEFVRGLSPGTEVEVWVDPRAPERSFLFEPKLPYDPDPWVAIGVMVALGGLVFGFRKEEAPEPDSEGRRPKGEAPPRPSVRVMDRLLRGLRVCELRCDVSGWNSDALRLELVPESSATAEAKRKGMGELEVGDPAFDDAFFVSTNLPARAVEVLTPAVRERCLSLATLLDGSYTSIQLNGLFLTVDKRLPDDRDPPPETRDRLLALYQELRALVLAALTGRPLPAAAASPDELAITGADAEGDAWACPVCGEGAAREVRACPVCETRHHEECWRYAGGCALFACPGGGGAPN